MQTSIREMVPSRLVRGHRDRVHGPKAAMQLACRFDDVTFAEIKRRAKAEKCPAAKIVRDLIALALRITNPSA